MNSRDVAAKAVHFIIFIERQPLDYATSRLCHAATVPCANLCGSHAVRTDGNNILCFSAALECLPGCARRKYSLIYSMSVYLYQVYIYMYAYTGCGGGCYIRRAFESAMASERFAK